ncbi:hypothetical protein DFH07DRAFT_773261 [Mycena maculata]|uniref:Uncharacterized protein n=1 Tax=Mycena maculata TaxID=230809 RepID=A0AAD7NDI9_9AGAR|nr:hypothetical protein DFH07DRAFT_773261 [Mycena maculata]
MPSERNVGIVLLPDRVTTSELNPALKSKSTPRVTLMLPASTLQDEAHLLDFEEQYFLEVSGSRLGCRGPSVISCWGWTKCAPVRRIRIFAGKLRMCTFNGIVQEVGREELDAQIAGGFEEGDYGVLTNRISVEGDAETNAAKLIGCEIGELTSDPVGHGQQILRLPWSPMQKPMPEGNERSVPLLHTVDGRAIIQQQITSAASLQLHLPEMVMGVHKSRIQYFPYAVDDKRIKGGRNARCDFDDLIVDYDIRHRSMDMVLRIMEEDRSVCEQNGVHDAHRAGLATGSL